MTKTEWLFVLGLLGVAYYFYTRQPAQPLVQPLPAFPTLRPLPQPAWSEIPQGVILN